jgi:hypothetical protein
MRDSATTSRSLLGLIGTERDIDNRCGIHIFLLLYGHQQQ